MGILAFICLGLISHKYFGVDADTAATFVLIGIIFFIVPLFQR